MKCDKCGKEITGSTYFEHDGQLDYPKPGYRREILCTGCGEKLLDAWVGKRKVEG